MNFRALSRKMKMTMMTMRKSVWKPFFLFFFFSFLFLFLIHGAFLSRSHLGEKNSQSHFLEKWSTAFSLLFFHETQAQASQDKEKTFHEAEGLQTQNQKKAKQSQSQVSRFETERRSLLEQYRMILQETETTRLYNKQTRRLIVSQEEEMKSIRVQMESLKRTQSEVIPLMLRMLNNLEKFVSLDVPFLLPERRKRLENLKTIMDSAKVSSSEKFRRVMEAYQIENDYGRTIEAYRGLQNLKGKEITVDFLRIGRLVFVYQSLDHKKQGIWNQRLKKWEILEGKYRNDIIQALRIARKQRAPDILKLPIFGPEKKEISLKREKP